MTNRIPWLSWVAGSCLGLAGGASACVVPNPEHCLHRDFDADAWCAKTFASRKFCSPCEAENFGCVLTQPTEDSCPEYGPPADTGGSDTGTSGQ